MPPEDDDAPISMTELAGLLAPVDEGDNAEDASGNDGKSAAATNGSGDHGTPDQGTDADEPEDTSDEGDQETDDQGDEPSTEPLYTVKIDGKDERVTLKEALAGYQRQVDYTRKTEEVANARKAVETETAQARAARDQYAQVLQVVLERLGTADQEPTAEQWNALRQADPAGYATQWTDYQRREQQRNAVREEQARLANEKRAETVQTARGFIDSERVKLVKALPIFADREKGPAQMKVLRDYAGETFGFSDAEIDQAYDHRMILMLDKARRWDNHQAALKKAAGKIANATQVPAPGARQPPTAPKAAQRKAAQEKFNRSGDIDDAVPLLLGR